MNLRALAIAVFVFVLTPSLFAAVPPDYKELPIDQTNPTINTCTAYRSLGQKCRSCVTNIRVDGSRYGTCTSSSYSDRCACTGGTPSCTTQGECTYSYS